MKRCRVHVFPPDDDDVRSGPEETEKKNEELKTAFDELFTEAGEATVQNQSREWVSEVFEETPENVETVDEFEAFCHDVYPESNVLRTVQERDVMDGRGSEHGYDVAIMFQITHKIT